MKNKFDILAIICAIFLLIMTIVFESTGRGSFKYEWVKYFFIVSLIISIIISWLHLRGKFRVKNSLLANHFYEEGLAFYEKRNFNAAISNFKMALNMDPDFIPAHHMLGFIFLEKGNLRSSINEFRKIIEINPYLSYPYYYLGIALRKKGKMKEAVVEFKKSLHLEPNDPNTLQELEKTLKEINKQDKSGVHSGLAFKARFLEAKNIALLLVCLGAFLLIIALGDIGDNIKNRHVLLYALIFISGIFSFSSGMHKLKFETLDYLIFNISSVAIVLFIIDLFLDYLPQYTILGANLSINELSTLLLIAIIFGFFLFISGFTFATFAMDEIKMPITDNHNMADVKIDDLFPKMKICSILTVFVIEPIIFWTLSLFVSGFTVNFFGTLIGVFAIGSFKKRWILLLSKIGIINETNFDEIETKFKGNIQEDLRFKDKSNLAEETYSNDIFGFSIKYPKGWKNNDKLLEKEMLFDFIDSKFGSINLMAGPTFQKQESIKDLENLAIRNVNNQHGEMEYLKHIKVDDIEAIEAVYSISQYIMLRRKIKKVAFVKDDIEYIISCGTTANSFDEYEPIFDACIQSFKFNKSD